MKQVQYYGEIYPWVI